MEAKFYWVPATFLFQIRIIFNVRKFRIRAISSSPQLTKVIPQSFFIRLQQSCFRAPRTFFALLYLEEVRGTTRKYCFITLPHFAHCTLNWFFRVKGQEIWKMLFQKMLLVIITKSARRYLGLLVCQLRLKHINILKYWRPYIESLRKKMTESLLREY